MKYLCRRNAKTLKKLELEEQVLITFDKPYLPADTITDLDEAVIDDTKMMVQKLLSLKDIYWGHHVGIFVDFKRNEGDEIYERRWWIRGFTLAYDPFTLGEKQLSALSEIYKIRANWHESFRFYLPLVMRPTMLTEKTEILEV